MFHELDSVRKTLDLLDGVISISMDILMPSIFPCSYLWYHEDFLDSRSRPSSPDISLERKR
eukprot:4457386-Amphidinium_carterae.1